jgi:glycosyltransferase involved in cell wall biosynthesis
VFGGCSIAVVMPAYNVEPLVRGAVRSVPPWVDHLLVVDDGSTDGTAAAVEGLQRPRLSLLRHPDNRGVGAAITSGYAEARRLGADVVAVMAGDGQMDPADLPRLLRPVVQGEADYAKGNRFKHPDVWSVMPRTRLVGNIALSLLTRASSGYWRIFDSQCGYTAISRHALRAVNGSMFARYGYPNDLLARLHSAGARVRDVRVRPVYEGQPSGIRVRTVFYPILFVLLRSLGRRLRVQLRRRLAGQPPAQMLDRAAGPLVSRADRPADHLLPAPPR